MGVAPRTEAQIGELRHALDAALRELGTAHFVVPVPAHPVVARVVRDAARSSRTPTELAARHGTSARHVQRVVLQETGLPFGRWRARARLNPAIARLRAGESFEQVARAVGYSSRSGLAKALAREVDDATLAALRGTERSD
ncbi:methylphosphotriester-DNA--protein-cysteine methyltransferase [Pseudoclavibacter chungangensis]|uniref:helix-turn-helix domain-containing protein n=1 Tax=Pseudoclavibacter chungangensis TaxID=587635 RepID=UPI001854E080|nr:helix-turn-helix domain-containing protein [Pseudoclavibacter chungangensis]NYJ65271.1 methylphosphotriester-DNA--protein-cysteine methyltransferase [Pseudoclavibacter chungangensis]